MQVDQTIAFETICEQDNFLLLFPHRFDYIWAEYSAPGAKVEWRTETRHPLSDRLIRQGSYLYGVRFGAETQYALLDIDAGSFYHPERDPFAILRIIAALEPLGLTGSVACTSSYSGGLHLYFPFQQVQSSWQIAIGLASLLENAGFRLQPGQLEVFPNPKPFAIDGSYSLFNAHRLPLQNGSYLLDSNWQPIWSDQRIFLQQWQAAQAKNEIDSRTLKQILKQARKRHYGISGKASKFINDLNAEIEMGWTGAGQTNRLLGRIAMRSYIFHHTLSGGEPLTGQALVNEIVNVARSLPGYEEWCGHRHEIEHRAAEWAHCVENSHYYHFGYQMNHINAASQDKELNQAIAQSPSWNQQQLASARDRIKRAIADLLEKGVLPVQPTARFHKLLQYGIGGGSLYRHRDLWHPQYFDTESIESIESADFTLETQSEIQLGTQLEVQPVENPPHPPGFNQNSQLDCLDQASNWLCSTSLFPPNGGNPAQDKAFTDSQPDEPRSTVGNRCPAPAAEGFEYVHQALAQAKAQRQADQAAKQLTQTQQQRIRSETHQQQRVEQMQQYLASGDPILIAEARAWAAINPGILDQPSATLAPE